MATRWSTSGKAQPSKVPRKPGLELQPMPQRGCLPLRTSLHDKATLVSPHVASHADLLTESLQGHEGLFEGICTGLRATWCTTFILARIRPLIYPVLSTVWFGCGLESYVSLEQLARRRQCHRPPGPWGVRQRAACQCCFAEGQQRQRRDIGAVVQRAVHIDDHIAVNRRRSWFRASSDWGSGLYGGSVRGSGLRNIHCCGQRPFTVTPNIVGWAVRMIP
ncbi:hypothetical protein OBBRIDRAFT_224174 [Obba rivulosa]|uniref:Uncharacterized protein n=1 Tax=Obba rivulosa TaxID=1052685 RepID=A0A8E2DGY7_9APHY|nr:hypothetical protein OBBRIDRAFT_224174 [Obba rivulosa]